eukprot:TRINITY_DN109441_c0_g1_i1.p1 TRINITY_DN109441_c0_g1~~TRINITY_DN109441_c0_g1_i1.p1  ORF type:complete len:268 (-),score=83.66 TRINITY_DN109441_c0_g1_i1:39-842(-)
MSSFARFQMAALLLLLVVGAETLEAAKRSAGSALVQVGASHRPSFFDQEAGSSGAGPSAGLSIGEAASLGRGRTSPVEVLEAVDQSRPSAEKVAGPSSLASQEEHLTKSASRSTFSLLNGARFKEAEESASKLLSLVTAGAQAAAESAMPSLMSRDDRAASTEELKEAPALTKPSKAAASQSPSAIGLFDQVQQQAKQADPHALAALQRSAEPAHPTLKVQRLGSELPVAEEARHAEERAKQKREEEERKAFEDLEDSMDSLRGASW